MLRQKLFENTKQGNNANKEEDNRNSELLDLSLQSCPSADVSKYFPNIIPLFQQLLDIQQNLNNKLNQINLLNLKDVKFVYNPTEYAAEPHELYFKKYCTTTKKILFVGMNPGPFGMCQTGVPFGDTNWVKNWLQIVGQVHKPPVECPNRPIQGFNCTRKEQSGDRFWKFWSDVCGTPDKFFSNAFVYNHCPLAFMDDTGRNLTPADIKDCKELELICDKHYWDVIEVLQPEILITIGRYIEKRTLGVLKAANAHIPVINLPHPSPRSPNNHNWPEKATQFLQENDLLRFFQ